MRLLRTWLTSERGQSLIEFALLLPILVFGLVGGTDLARAYALQLAVVNGSRAGAESAVIGYNLTDAQIIDYARQEMSRTPGLDPSAATILVTRPQISGTNYITVEVLYTFRTLYTWPLVPNVANFDRSTTMRVFP